MSPLKIVVSVKTMKLSGNREEYYVCINCDGREITPHKFSGAYRNRAQYEVDSWKHVLLNEPEPDISSMKYRDSKDPTS